jgi:hypothetical protein
MKTGLLRFFFLEGGEGLIKKGNNISDVRLCNRRTSDQQ